MSRFRYIEGEEPVVFPPFRDRRDAGQQLALRLDVYRERQDVVVLALPRGGVPVAHEVSRYLHAPLDVFLVRKLGVPGQEELAMGAIASGGVVVLNDDVVSSLRIPKSAIEAAEAREARELERREREFRGQRPPLSVAARTLILIDDGIATGSTMRAAILALRRLGAAPIVAAAPVGAPATCADLSRIVDDLVCPVTPPEFEAVGEYYENFSQTTDDEVRDLLQAE